jgi:hypothetical protein
VTLFDQAEPRARRVKTRSIEVRLRGFGIDMPPTVRTVATLDGRRHVEFSPVHTTVRKTDRLVFV